LYKFFFAFHTLLGGARPLSKAQGIETGLYGVHGTSSIPAADISFHLLLQIHCIFVSHCAKAIEANLSEDDLYHALIEM
jgi:hypothetical protein